MKSDQNLCENLYEKSLIYWWNVQKVLSLNNAEYDWKKIEKWAFSW